MEIIDILFYNCSMWKNYLKAIITWFIVLLLLRIPFLFLLRFFLRVFSNFLESSAAQFLVQFLVGFLFYLGFPGIATFVALFVFSRSLMLKNYLKAMIVWFIFSVLLGMFQGVLYSPVPFLRAVLVEFGLPGIATLISLFVFSHSLKK